MKISLKKLSHHPLNEEIYSLSSIEDLKSSIDEVGLLQPLVVNQKFQVLSGNRRLEAVTRLGWKSVEVEKIDSDTESEPQMIVHFNKQRVKTCRELLNEIYILMPQYSVGQGKRTDLTNVRTNKSSARDEIADLVGMSSSQIGKLLFIEKNDPDFIKVIDDGELTINQAYLSVSREKKQRDAIKGQFRTPTQKDKGFVFYNKSSHDMSEVKDESVDLIFTSPPYWNKRKYSEEGGLGNEKSPSEFVANLVDHLGDCKRVLNKQGSFFLVLGDTFENGNLLSIPHRVALGLQDEGWLLRNTIVWKKTNPKPTSSKTNLTQSYEFIFHLVKSLDYRYEHTLSEMKEGARIQHSPRHREMTDKRVMMKPFIPRDGKNMGDFWDEDVVKTAVVRNIIQDNDIEHPAPFPEDIVKLPILQTTNEGDVVLDPFMGSGTTGKVARDLGRQFIGYDVRVFQKGD
jgi:DNA modification methylase